MSAQPSIDELLHQAFSGAPSSKSSEFSENFYRVPPPPIDGYFDVETPFVGIVDGQRTNKYKIAYTQWGDRGPVILFLHGVPTNRSQYYELQKRLAPFCQTYSIDMLGMGESSHPLNYGQDEIRDLEGFDWVRGQVAAGNKPWSWIFDTIYIEQIHRNNFGDNSIIFVADDWGAGILSHYAARRSNKLAGAVWIDPIAFDGYPVSEIQAFGRASQLNDEQFAQAMGAADQTMVQIFKTMVYDPNVWNQYTLRNIKKTYIDVDYERRGANSLTLGLKMNALRVMADRAAVLSPDLLLPYHSTERPLGVKYSQITCPSKVIWGMQDNMMPERQIWRFLHALVNARVTVHSVANAGHFAAVDQPDEVAESIMGFLLEDPDWRPLMGDVFLGFGGKHRIYKGDEREVVRDLRKLYSQTSASPASASPRQTMSPSPVQVVSVTPSQSPSPRSPVQVVSVSPSQSPSPRTPIQVVSVAPSQSPSPRSPVQVGSVTPSPVLSTPPVTQIAQPSTVVSSPPSTSVTYISSGTPSRPPSPRTSVTVLSPTPRASPSPRSTVSPVSTQTLSQQSPPSPTGTMTPTAMVAPQTSVSVVSSVPSPVSIPPRSATVIPISTIAAVPPSPRTTSPGVLSAPLSLVSTRSPSPRTTVSPVSTTRPLSPVSIPQTTTTTVSSVTPVPVSPRTIPSPVSIPQTTTTTVSSVGPAPISPRTLSPVGPAPISPRTVSSLGPAPLSPRPVSSVAPLSPRSVASPILTARPAPTSPRPVLNIVPSGTAVTSPRSQSLPPLTLGNTQVSPTVVTLPAQ